MDSALSRESVNINKLCCLSDTCQYYCHQYLSNGEVLALTLLLMRLYDTADGGVDICVTTTILCAGLPFTQ